MNEDKLGGTINGSTAAVHVLGEDENGWTKIEGLDYYNRVIRGYVKTNLLKTVTPRDDYGIIIDKLTQKLYVFKEGKLWSSCMVSTGLPNDEQPYNETRSGEFLYISPTGGFWSDNMFCPRAMKFNDGDLLHEVPYVQRSEGGSKIYSATEPYLGQRASHGCIRVQRKRTASGINMRWIWSAMAKQLNSRFVIWEDWPGRSLSIPAGDTPVYYNPNGGTNYHSVAECLGVKERYLPLTAFTYAELDTGIYADLTPCGYCVPPRRVSEIEAINNAHLFE